MSDRHHDARPSFENLEDRILMSVAPIDDHVAVVASVEAQPAAQEAVAASEIVFIDSAVHGAQALLANIPANAEVITLNASSSGVDQISAVLSGRSNISAIHIISHGTDGALKLGNSTLDASNVAATSAWKAALSQDADILVYGCDVGAGTEGAAFVAALAATTGADVAASDDNTSAADSDLEVTVGAIQTAYISFSGFQGDLAVFATVITVNDVDASNPSWGLESDINNTIGGYAFKLADFPGLSATGAVKIIATPGAGTLSAFGSTVTAGSVVPATVFDDGNFTFLGSVDTTFTYKIGTFAGNDVNGNPTFTFGSTLDASIDVVTTIQASEDNSYTFTLADFGLDGSTPRASRIWLDTTNISFGGAATQGTLSYRGFTITKGSVTAAQITSGYLKYSPGATPNYAYTSVEYVLQQSNGNWDYSNPEKLSITVEQTNDAPAGTDVTKTINEDAVYSFAAVDFGFTDVIDGVSFGGADTFMAVTITTLPTAGSLSIASGPSAGAVTLGQSIAVADLALLRFTPVTDASGSPYSSFTFQVQDDGGTAHGGIDLDASANTFTFNVLPGNDAPVVNDQTFSVPENSANSTAVGTVLASDIDVGDVLTYTITAGNTGGTFAINASTGAITVANNTLLDFETNPTFTLTVRVTDNGTGLLFDTAAVTINVTNVNEAPVVTSGATASFAENTVITTAAYTATATDVDAGSVLTYSLGGVDAALFDINATTGVVTFKVSPNFEAPADAGANNVYDITVTATDAGMMSSAAKAVAITVTNVNEAPTITSGATASFAENTVITTAAYTAIGADVDAGDVLTYTLGGTDAGLFNINASTGAVTFKVSPNFEAPADAGANNVYDITVTATDAGSLSSAAKAVAITVTNVNEAPVITSGATATFAENTVITTAAYTATATDVDAGSTLTYSIGGTDGALFDINATTGVVTFKTSPNFELPADAGGNNVYDITVTANDSALNSVAKDVAITVTNVNEAPTITSGATASFAENTVITTAAYTAIGADVDAGSILTYTLGGTDASLFNINATTGAVTFKVSPNFEAPADAGANNVYDITVTATDAGTLSSAAKAVAITVTNVNEAPVVDDQTFSIPENSAVSTAVGTVLSSDVDAADTRTYSITAGNTGSTFAINASTGVITVADNTILNFETNPTFTLTVQVTDAGTLSDTALITINLTNVNEAPTITSGASANFAENTVTTTAAYTATAGDVDAGSTVTFTLGGTDAALFDINATTGVVTFKVSPNFEAPADADTNNVYDITVTATDSGLLSSAPKAVAITVTNVNEAPTITSGATASFAENTVITAAAYTAIGADVDAGSVLTYTLGGTDAALFNINATTGVVTFKVSPNFEAPADAGANNVYDITVTATDAGSLSSAAKAVAITVTNVNEAPTVTSGATATLAENTATSTTVYTAVGADVDAGTVLTYTLGGTDAALFDINASTGAVTFKVSPNFEMPSDAGANNVYDITVTATDAGMLSSAAKDVAITVTNVNEAPTITSGATASFAENTVITTAAYTAIGADVDAGSVLTYTLGGTDAALFDINASTGAVTFKVSPNFEAPADAGANNVYDITVTATDAGTLSSAAKAVAITVTNVNEAPVITSGGTANFAENAVITTAAYTTTATDVDAGTTLTYTIGGTDGALFDINASTGVVTFKVSPNFELPGDAGGNNVYDITITANDSALNSVAKAVAITVTNVNEAPTITSGATASFAENTVITTTAYTAVGADVDAGSVLTYSLGGTDAALFDINASTGAVTFKVSPNFEIPSDAGANNVYDITVTATDAGSLSSAAKAVAITVTNVNEAPVGVADGYAAEVGVVLTVPALTGVLANDTDVDAGATRTAVLGTTVAKGSLTLNADGSFTFDPTAGTPAVANDVVTFTYTAFDGGLSSGVTTVSITVLPALTITGPNTIVEPGVNENPDVVAEVNDQAYIVSVAGDTTGNVLSFQVSTNGGTVWSPVTVTAPASLVSDGVGATSYTLDLNALADTPALDSSNFKVRVTETLAGGGSRSKVLAVKVDNAANKPVINTLSSANASNAWNYGFSGTGEIGAIVNYSVSGVVGSTPSVLTGSAVVNGSGVWTVSGVNFAAFNDGTITISATQTDIYLNLSAPESKTLTKDTSAVVFTGALGNVTASSNSAYRVSGYAKPGATVQISVGGIPSTVTADAETGSFSAEVNMSGVTPGPVQVIAKQTKSGVTSADTVSNIVKNTAIITSPTVNATTGGTASSFPVSGTGTAGSTITIVLTQGTDTVVLSGIIVASNGTWSSTVNLSTMASGSVTITVYERLLINGNQSKNVTAAASTIAAVTDDVHLDIEEMLDGKSLELWVKAGKMAVEDLSWTDFMDRPSLSESLTLEVDAFQA